MLRNGHPRIMQYDVMTLTTRIRDVEVVSPCTFGKLFDGIKYVLALYLSLEGTPHRS